jgi:hypothetical protein
VPHILAADAPPGRGICEGVLAASASYGDAVRFAPERGGLVVTVP